jgi:uncharacterized protein (TIGR00369 family)
MTLPPYAHLLGLIAETDEHGAPVLLMPFSAAVLGRPGFLHGGAMGGLMEMAAIAALRHALGATEVGIKPVNLTVDYMRGGRELETRAKGLVRRLGTRIANTDVICWQDDADRPIATARLTFLLRR